MKVLSCMWGFGCWDYLNSFAWGCVRLGIYAWNLAVTNSKLELHVECLVTPESVRNFCLAERWVADLLFIGNISFCVYVGSFLLLILGSTLGKGGSLKICRMLKWFYVCYLASREFVGLDLHAFAFWIFAYQRRKEGLVVLLFNLNVWVVEVLVALGGWEIVWKAQTCHKPINQQLGK